VRARCGRQGLANPARGVRPDPTKPISHARLDYRVKRNGEHAEWIGASVRLGIAPRITNAKAAETRRADCLRRQTQRGKAKQLPHNSAEALASGDAGAGSKPRPFAIKEQPSVTITSSPTPRKFGLHVNAGKKYRPALHRKRPQRHF